MTDDLYNVNKYTNKQLYDILDMNNPTDRELEAKIIHLINKYSNMQNESGDQLSLFFQNIYDRFFYDTDNNSDINESNNIVEGFDPKIDATKNTINGNIVLTESPVVDGTIQNKTIGYTPQQINSVQQFDYSADKLQLNPLVKQTIKRIISIDSQYRDIRTNPLTTSFTFDLSEPLRDVVSLKLYSIQIPYTWYTISKSYGSNFLYLKGVSSQINNGLHDYKIEISAGNYSAQELVDAINNSFIDVSNNTSSQPLISASDVNFNGLSLFTYDSVTSKTTCNLNLQKIYNECYYQIYFPNWTSPKTDISGSIPAYFGFNNNSYNFNSVSSNQLYLPTTAAITNNNILDYTLDDSNNYFTVINYLGLTEFSSYSDIGTTEINRYLVKLKNENNLDATGIVSRENIISYIKNGLNYLNIFDPVSGIKRKDIIGNVQNSGNSYFQLEIVLNRYKIKSVPNSKLLIIFPNEDPLRNYTIWTYNLKSDHNCFFFDTSMNEVSQFISESPSVISSYLVDGSTNILFTCRGEEYGGGVNDFSFNIPQSPPLGYSLQQYINVINTSFTNYSVANENIFNTTNTHASIDSITSKFKLDIDLTKTFSTNDYDIYYDDSSILCKIKEIGYGGGFENQIDTHLSQKSEFGGKINVFTTGYEFDVSYIFTIKPNQTNANIKGNKNANPVIVTLPQSSNNQYNFQTYTNLVTAINTAITTTTINTGINYQPFPLRTSSFTVTVNPNNYTIVDLSLNINYLFELTEANYDISFNDGNKIMKDSSWKYLDISSNYNLYSQSENSDGTYRPYAQIIGNTPISGNQINIDASNNKIIIQTNTSTNSLTNIPSESITLTIDNGTYTLYTLYSKINQLFNKTSKLYGSIIQPFIKNNITYTLLRININNIFTSNDYNLVFYDPISFIICYSGARSVQNTTWDSTIGWILGFRDYTQYSFIQSNQIKDNNFIITGKYYYLTSINGSYLYTTSTNKNSNLLTNTIISIVSDTTLSTNLFNYFLISLDDFIQNHLNDGLITITRNQTAIPLPSYSYATTQFCDPGEIALISSSTSQSNSDNVTNNQLYALNQSIISNKNTLKTYSSGPFIKDLFGIIPIKPPAKNGDYYIEFGGSLQNQERLYFGPVNIRKMSIQLLNDRGDVVDLNGSNWSFSFICEQLYKAPSS